MTIIDNDGEFFYQCKVSFTTLKGYIVYEGRAISLGESGAEFDFNNFHENYILVKI